MITPFQTTVFATVLLFATASQAAEVTITRNVEYSKVGDQPLLCDLYEPPIDAEEHGKVLRPAVVVVHGGGWATGDKWNVSSYARAFAEQGMVAVAINYRHAPVHKFPTQVDDVRSSLVWLVDHAEAYAVDVKRIGLFGYSAGAHLSCMIGTLTDAQWSTIEKTTQWEQKDARWNKLPDIIGIVGGGAPATFASYRSTIP